MYLYGKIINTLKREEKKLAAIGTAHICVWRLSKFKWLNVCINLCEFFSSSLFFFFFTYLIFRERLKRICENRLFYSHSINATFCNWKSKTDWFFFSKLYCIHTFGIKLAEYIQNASSKNFRDQSESLIIEIKLEFFEFVAFQKLIFFIGDRF